MKTTCDQCGEYKECEKIQILSGIVNICDDCKSDNQISKI